MQFILHLIPLFCASLLYHTFSAFADEYYDARGITDAICRKRCSSKEQTKCHKSCLKENLEADWNSKTKRNQSLVLFCQNAYLIQNKEFKVELYFEPRERPHIDPRKILYIWEKRRKNGKWTIVKWAPRVDDFHIKNISTSSLYRFRVTVTDIYGNLIQRSTSDWIKSLNEYQISSPKLMNVSKYEVESGSLNTIFYWEPPDEKFCSYDIYWFSKESERLGHQRILKVNSVDRFSTKIDGLNFGTNYTLSIASMIMNLKKSKNPLQMHFQTPKCLPMNNYSFDLCAPGKVESLTSRVYKIHGNISVKISWKLPKYSSDNNQVSGFKVRLAREVNYMLGNKAKFHFEDKKLNQNETSISFYGLMENSSYKVQVKAISIAGESEETETMIEIQPMKSSISYFDKDDLGMKIGIGSGVTFAILVLVLVAFSIAFKKLNNKKLDKKIKEDNCLSPSMIQIPMDPPHEKNGFEVDIRRVVKVKVIGEGSFGMVYSGHLMMKSSLRRVAIKTLKATSSTEDRTQLCEEIHLLRSVGKHPHIVSIVACSTTSENICLLMEYCQYGDLRSYLQKSRNNEVINTEYTQTGEIVEVSYFDLVSYSRQIANGMEFLASNKIVHRDLAARNVLVKNKKIVKITDFGLAKDVYERGHYHLTSNKKLPIKWMAMESIFDHIFTTKSDVWSYGILLWEIMTLGATPYPGIIGLELVPLLKEGYRLSKPDNCIDEVFEIMKMCWRPKLSSRPTFGAIRRYLDEIIEATITYLNLESGGDFSLLNRTPPQKSMKRSISLMLNPRKSMKSVFDKSGRSYSEVLIT